MTDTSTVAARLEKLCYWLLIACVAASMLAVAEFLPEPLKPLFPTYSKYLVCQTLAALLAVCGFAWWLGTRRSSGLGARPSQVRFAFPVLLGAYAAWSGLSYLWSAWPYGAQGYFIRELIFYFLCGVFFLVFGSARRWRAFAVAFLLSAVAAALVQSAYILLKRLSTKGHSINEIFYGRPFLYGNVNFSCAQNILAALIALGFAVLCLRKFLAGRDRQERSVWPIVGVTCCIAAIGVFAFLLVAANSLAGYLAAGLGLVVYALCILPFRKRGLVAGGVSAVIAVGVLSVLFVPSLRDRAREEIFKKDSTTLARVIWWKATGEMFLARPLTGWGIGSYGSVYYRFAPPRADQYRTTRFVQATHPHNEFLRLLAELGIVGLGLYVALLAAAFVVSYRAIRRQDFGVQAVGFALWSGGLAYLVHVAVGKEVMSWDFALGYWMLIGTLASSSLWRQRPAETADRRFAMTSKSWAALALTAGLLVCGWWHWGLGGYRSMIYLKDAKIRGEIILKAESLRRAEQMRDFLAKAEPRSLWPTEILRYRYALGASFFPLKRYAEAAEQFELIERAAPGFTEVELQLGKCYLMLGQRERAREPLESFVQKHPTVTEGYENLARADVGLALELLLKQVAAERFGEQRRVALTGAILAELGQWDAVEQLLSETQKHNAQSSLKRLVRTLDRAYERLGMTEKAEELRKRFPSAFEAKGSTAGAGE